MNFFLSFSRHKITEYFITYSGALALYRSQEIQENKNFTKQCGTIGPVSFTNFVFKVTAAAAVMIVTNDRVLCCYEVLADMFQLLWLNKKFA